ncbi:MAG: hypothetical protein AAB382_10700, partial [Chloroflexota bacterium]
MAELRCPMCSKINPDTLDVCQFCGARLRPLFLSPTTPLERPAEPGKPATTPAPAPTTQPSSGGTDDWLAKLRAQDEFEEPESAPAPPAEAGSVAGGAGAESSDQNDWLGSLRASGSEAPSWLSEPVEPEPQKDDVNWLQTSGSADETLVSKGKQLAAEPQAEVALPDWLQESGRIGDTSVGLQPPAAEVALPDWRSESAAPPAPTTPPGQTAILETDWVDSTLSDATSSLPDWLKPPSSADETIVSKGKQPAARPGTPDWLPPSSAAETPAPAEAPQESSLPNWLDSPVIKKATGPIEAQPPTQPPAPTTPPGEKSVVGTTDWLATFSTEQQQPITAPEAKKSGVTGWLSSLTPDQVAETPPATPPGDKAVVGVTDWLAGDEAVPTTTELPDWLQGSEPSAQPPAPTTPPSEKSVVSTTDWLAKFSAEQQQPVTPLEAK